MIMAALVVIAKVNAYRAQEAIEKIDFEKEAPQEIYVIVKGEVKEASELTLPKESRICDLQEKINLTDNADTAFFKRRKRLKNGEIIVVPKKTVEQKKPLRLLCWSDI